MNPARQGQCLYRGVPCPRLGSGLQVKYKLVAPNTIALGCQISSMSSLQGLTAVVKALPAVLVVRSRSSSPPPGASVLVHGRRSTEAARAVAQAVREHGVEATVEMADVADPAQARSFVERLGVARWGRHLGQ